MHKEISRPLLFHYFAGQATSEQKRQIEVWLSSSQENQELFFEWMEEWERQNPKYNFDVKRDFAMLKERIMKSDQQDKQHSIRERTGRKAAHFMQGWKRMAAVFLLLLMATAAYFFPFQAMDVITYQTHYGEMQTIILPDQSTVQMNANSRLKFLNNWDDQHTREIWLEGEAFFSVVHTENDQKFIVHSNHIEIEVLGTEFNVNGRHKATRVVLNSGKIQLYQKGHKAEESVTLVPGDLVEYTEEKGTFKRKKVNPSLYTSWRNNELIFNQTPIHEVIQLLEDNYGLEIVVTDQNLQNQTFTATLPANDAEVLLKALSKSFGLNLAREDHNRIILQSEK